MFLLLSLSDCKRQRFGGGEGGKVTPGHPRGGGELEREEAKNIGFWVPGGVPEPLPRHLLIS